MKLLSKLANRLGTEVRFHCAAPRRSERFWVPVDNFMEMRYAHGIRSLSVLPYPIEHLPLGSTIGDRAVRNKPLRWRLRRLWFRSLHDLNRYAWAARRFWSRKLHGSWRHKRSA